MAMQIDELEALELWRRTIVKGVRHDVPDLSTRQMAILLTVYLTPPPHTVRGLAHALNVSKPAVTRALDRLSELGLALRKTDESDRRSVLIQRTPQGSSFLRDYGQIIVASSRDIEESTAWRSGYRPWWEGEGLWVAGRHADTVQKSKSVA